ncbi:MAG: hypothetical protein ABS939_00770 [Psychrobacillus sp.]
MQLQYKFSSGEISTDFEVNIKGDTNNTVELRLKAIKHILKSFDIKNDFNGDHEKLNQVIEETLLAAVDVIGYEHFYWDNLPKEEKYYNDHDELVVSKAGKLQLLELIMKDMKNK